MEEWPAGLSLSSKHRRYAPLTAQRRIALVRQTKNLAAVRIGCAGWSISTAEKPAFPASGSHLERYAQVFDAVEINSSFYRPHRPATYRRWADSVPAHFRFAVKLARSITHHAHLQVTAAELAGFFVPLRELGEKLGPVLIQLPPSLVYSAPIAVRFFTHFRKLHPGSACIEPRHASWFTTDVESLLREHDIARVGADPALQEEASIPGGDLSLRYLRLHGSPRMYYSAYDADFLHDIAARLRAFQKEKAQAWCIFDNTAHGAAVPNALALRDLLAHR
jgi:uncharacterized protein YecE (DUF72 family)